jgi:DNA-binding LacI/PurR family transcriptional regulator
MAEATGSSSPQGVRGTREDESQRLGIPWLCVNRTGPGRRRYVVRDDAQAAAMAVEHLVKLGHRKLAFISGPGDSDSARRRQQGYEGRAEASEAHFVQRIGGVVNRMVESRDPPSVLLHIQRSAEVLQ